MEKFTKSFIKLVDGFSLGCCSRVKGKTQTWDVPSTIYCFSLTGSTRKCVKLSNQQGLQAVVSFLTLSTHPVISILLLHGVCVEEADDCAKLCLPVLFMNVTKQEQRHKHVQVMEVIQLPDAEGFPLHDKAQLTPRTQYADTWSLKVAPLLLKQGSRNTPTLLLLFCVVLLTTTANVTQSLSSSFSRAKRSGSWDRRIIRRSAILRSISLEETRGLLK